MFTCYGGVTLNTFANHKNMRATLFPSQRLIVTFVAVLAFFVTNIRAKAQELQTPSEPEALRKSFWGLCVQDASNGETVVDIRSHHLFTPASTLKLYSCGTLYALRQGVDRIPTYLCTAGTVSQGVLDTDLYIIGRGDPSIGSRFLYGQDKEAFFKLVHEALHKKGIHTIKGDIVAYTPASDFQGQNPRWLFYDMGNHYGAGAYALNVFDNAFEVKFTNSGASYTTVPSLPDVTIENRYTCSKRRYSDSLYLSPGLPLQQQTTMVLSGLYPATRPTLTIRGALPNPPLQMSYYLKNFLQQKGIKVEGKSTFSSHLPAIATRDTLCTYLSPPLRELIRLTNTYSLNLFAESILLQLAQGEEPIGGHNATQTAIQVARKYWQSRGLQGDEAEVYDGCGLSLENKVSPYFMCTFLGKMFRKPETHDFPQLLPMAGRDGTLTIFLKKTPLEGRARLKSGSLHNVIGYAGYIRHGNKTYTVAFFVNNFYGKASGIRKAMEQVLLETFGEVATFQKAA